MLPAHLALSCADEGDISPRLHPLHPLLLHSDSDGLGGGLCAQTRGLSAIPTLVPGHHAATHHALPVTMTSARLELLCCRLRQEQT